ncbi:hypothetical protein GJAV_G00094060 [Gymnothorax javanicus]|nr:hypothetical protein GJAV_G00094060 [Gymnothorax javanicus]
MGLCIALVVTIFSTLTVCRAEKPLFVQKGGAVRLDAQGYKGLELESITWRVNTTTILRYIKGIENPTKFGNYTTRVEFDKGNFSLLLKSLQQTDSGIYTAKITAIDGRDKDAAAYKLTVQEPLPKPHVAVALLSSAGGVCNVSVNCSAKDTWASYTCDHTHCTQVKNTTSPTGVSLIVTATNGTIQCSSSNWVSTATKTESIEDTCPQTKNTEQPNYVILIAVPVIIAVLLVIVVIIIIIIIIIIIRKRQRRSEGTQVVTQVNTDYATVEAVGLQNLSTVETMYDVVTAAKPEGPPQVNTVYDTLGPPGDNLAKPESIYATVNKSAA